MNSLLAAKVSENVPFPYRSFGKIYTVCFDILWFLAIKRQPGAPTPELVAELIMENSMINLTEMPHILRPFLQLLKFGNRKTESNMFMCQTDTALDSSTRLEFKQRLSIALGAAKDKARRI
ncbi:hypothetical protein SLEP1_g46834 [Rubroshorea leprosula]|uniref:LAGLIDADG homing endonuclease n=1 Tax=Rubroshorea leprosula TaxID=152421 RepID=A0AAV5LQC1_9ROSI|nr:hypothetical protein SLEP1_g46834 [Rubroshorea leprosula]